MWTFLLFDVLKNNILSWYPSLKEEFFKSKFCHPLKNFRIISSNSFEFENVFEMKYYSFPTKELFTLKMKIMLPSLFSKKNLIQSVLLFLFEKWENFRHWLFQPDYSRIISLISDTYIMLFFLSLFRWKYVDCSRLHVQLETLYLYVFTGVVEFLIFLQLRILLVLKCWCWFLSVNFLGAFSLILHLNNCKRWSLFTHFWLISKFLNANWKWANALKIENKVLNFNYSIYPKMVQWKYEADLL